MRVPHIFRSGHWHRFHHATFPKAGRAGELFGKGEQLNPVRVRPFGFEPEVPPVPRILPSPANPATVPRATPTVGSSEVQRLNEVEPGLTGPSADSRRFPCISGTFRKLAELAQCLRVRSWPTATLSRTVAFCYIAAFQCRSRMLRPGEQRSTHHYVLIPTELTTIHGD